MTIHDDLLERALDDIERQQHKCSHQTGPERFPYYGRAPHVDLPDSLRILPVSPDTWPKNFKPDPDLPGWGWWYCPDCEEEKSGT